MSKGLSKLQRAIVGLLDGTVPRAVYSPGALTTAELLEELACRGLVRPDMARKFAMFTVRRACSSLAERGILAGEYVVHDPYPWADVLSWCIAKQVAGDGAARNPSGRGDP